MKAKIAIETIGAQGDGIGRHGDDIVYLERTLPGEIVEADIRKDKDGIYRGQLTDIVQASEDRQKAPCLHYDVCGGCSAQHITDAAYYTWKTEKVRSLLQAKGIQPLQWDEPRFIPAHTRRRASFTAIKSAQDVVLGYNEKRSNRIVDIKQCPILDPDLFQMALSLKPYLVNMLAWAKPCDIFIQQCANGYDLVLSGFVGDKGKPDLAFLETAAAIIRETKIVRISWRKRERDTPETIVEAEKPVVAMGNMTVSVPPQGFLQPSVEGQDVLIAKVMDYLPDDAGKIADLFSGVGTFTSAVTASGRNCDAYESDKAAIHSLKKAGHQSAFQRNLFVDPLTVKELEGYDAVIIDPPRAGAKEQCRELSNSSVETIISVSCNPVTFARDTLVLIDGGYKLDKLTVVDQFIWSPHVELVGLLTR